MSKAKILEIGFGKLWIVVILIALNPDLFGQAGKTTKLLEFKYGFQAPMADMKDRFGGTNDIGASFQIASNTKTIFFGAEGIFFFGNNVKEDVLAHLRTFDGTIVANDGHAGDINLKERGYYLGLDGGKIFKTTSTQNNLTGLRTQLGIGFLQHKIRVQDNFNNVVSIGKAYVKGYDRLTNGPALHLGLGFQYDHPINNFHFSLMGDVYAAQTKSRRSYDNLEGRYLDEKRTDILAGLTLAYIVSISKTDRADHIYY